MKKSLLIISIIFFVCSLLFLGYRFYTTSSSNATWGENLFVERSDGDYDLVNNSEIVRARIYRTYEGVIASKTSVEQDGKPGVLLEINTELNGEKTLTLFIPYNLEVENGQGYAVIESESSTPDKVFNSIEEIDYLLVEGERVYIETINKVEPNLEFEGLNSFVLIQ